MEYVLAMKEGMSYVVYEVSLSAKFASDMEGRMLTY